jgi:hypothetical protein
VLSARRFGHRRLEGGRAAAAPADFKRDSETVHARFIAEGEIRTMKAFLQQMKNAGFF